MRPFLQTRLQSTVTVIQGFFLSCPALCCSAGTFSRRDNLSTLWLELALKAAGE